MDWNKGYSASYYIHIVDPKSWRDLDRLEITGGSVSRELSGLRQSADIDCADYELGQEQWVRVYLETIQNEGNEREALFTGLATSPDRNIKGAWEENTLQCYSVLKPADDVFLERGWYAPVEVNVGVLIRSLLAPVPAPITISEIVKTLDDAIVAEDGETNLTMIEKILAAADWDLRIAGDGSINVGPISSESRIVFDPLGFDAIENELKVSADWYACPNVFMAVNNEITAIAKDEDENSPLSIQNRGREVWMYESSCSLAQDETMGEYARRRLRDEQRYSMSVSYDRRYVPDVLPGDIISLHYPAQGIDGNFIVESQSIELGHGARTSEDVIGVGS